MKKFVKVLAFMAAFAVLALGVSADIGGSAVIDGDQVTFTLTTSEAGDLSGRGTIEFGSGLEIASGVALGVFNPANGMFSVAAPGVAAGTTILTVIFDVVDADGDLSINVVGAGNFDGLEIEIPEPEEVEEEPGPGEGEEEEPGPGEGEDEEPGPGEGEDEEPPVDGGEEEPGDGEGEEPGDETPGGDDEEEDDNPKGGVALAVIPAIVAAAAVAVSRKRK
ncbi:MAG: hypothetical protein LBC82_03150 [Oscillospiraceae bacterium]|jgi:hypothetical protein|nr:hypothetical protein [Oscillospiraceae bacterium]